MSNQDPQITITIDTAYRGDAVDAANSKLDAMATTVERVQGSLESLDKSTAPQGVADKAGKMSDNLDKQPATLASITEGWQAVGKGISFASASLGQVMWVATLINGSLELGSKLWRAWTADADQALERRKAQVEATRQAAADSAKAFDKYYTDRNLAAYEERLRTTREANIALLEHELELRRQAAEAVANAAYLEIYRKGSEDDINKARLDTELARGSISQEEHARRIQEIDMEARARQRAADEEIARREMMAKADVVGDRKAELDAAEARYHRNQAPQGMLMSGSQYRNASNNVDTQVSRLNDLEPQVKRLQRILQWQTQEAENAGTDARKQLWKKAADKTFAEIQPLQQEISVVQENIAKSQAKLKEARDFLKETGYWGEGDDFLVALGKWQKAQNYNKLRVDELKKDVLQAESGYFEAEEKYRAIGGKNDVDTEKDAQIKLQHDEQRTIERDKKDAEIIRQGNIAKAAAEIKALTDALAPLAANAAELAGKSQESRKALAGYDELVAKLPKGKFKIAAQTLQDRMTRYLAEADKGQSDPDLYRQITRTLKRGRAIPKDMRVDLLNMMGDASRAGSARGKVTTMQGRIDATEARKTDYERQPDLERVADDMRDAADNARKAIEEALAQTQSPTERQALDRARGSLADGYQTTDNTALTQSAQQLQSSNSPLAGQYIAQIQSLLQLVSSLNAQQQQMGAELKSAQRAIDTTRRTLSNIARSKY